MLVAFEQFVQHALADIADIFAARPHIGVFGLLEHRRDTVDGLLERPLRGVAVGDQLFDAVTA